MRIVGPSSSQREGKGEGKRGEKKRLRGVATYLSSPVELCIQNREGKTFFIRPILRCYFFPAAAESGKEKDAIFRPVRFQVPGSFRGGRKEVPPRSCPLLLLNPGKKREKKRPLPSPPPPSSHFLSKEREKEREEFPAFRHFRLRIERERKKGALNRVSVLHAFLHL